MPFWGGAAFALAIAAQARAQAVPQEAPGATAVAPAAATTWHGTASTDIYHVDVEVPAGGGGISSLHPGNHIRAMTSGELRVPGVEGDISHLQFSLTATDDRAVLSRFISQVGTVQAGYTAADRQVLIGDVAANLSRLAPGAGVRGALGSYAGGAVALSGYAGAAGESWEAMWGAPTRDRRPANLNFLREMYGGSMGLALSPQLKAFVTHQGYGDRSGSVNSDVAAGLGPTLRGRVTTAGLNYAQTIGSTTQLRASGEFGWAAQEAAAGLRRDDTAYMVDVGANTRWDDIGLGVRVGRNDLGLQWRTPSASLQPGLAETYSAVDLQWGSSVSASVEVRNSDVVTEGSLASQDQQSRTWRVTVTPQSLAGWSGTALGTTQEVAGNSTSRQNAASVDYNAPPFGASLSRARLSTSYRMTPEANSVMTESKVGIRYTWPSALVALLGADSAQWNGALGRQLQHTSYPTETDTRFALFSASFTRGAGTSFAVDLERKVMHDLTRGATYTSGSYGIHSQWPLAQSVAIRLHLKRNSTFRGLLSAELVERVGGVLLTYQW